MATASATAASAKKNSSAKHRNTFMKAMRTHHASAASSPLSKDQTPSLKTFTEEISGDSKRARKLRKKVMKKGRLVVPGEQQRRLQNYNQATDKGDGADDYFTTYGAWDNSFGFDPTQYSLSYHRCAAVRQYDDDIAAREDTTSVFATKQFAVFRFCPSKTCEGIREDAVDEEAYQYAEDQEVDMFDRLKVGGANGEGCQSSYGEYMLELEDYLAIMTEYHSERFEMYCETCEECMYDVYEQWLQQGGQNGYNRKLKDKTDPSWKAELESDEFQKAHRDLEYDRYKTCPEYDTCRYYQNVCETDVDESLSQYFECTEVQRSNGNVAYIGPHCSADGITITLGVFADEDCNEYIGNGVKIESFLGYELEGDELAPYVTGSLIDIIPEEGIQAQKERYSQNYDAELANYYSPVDNMCIPCMASRQPYQVRGNVEDYEDQAEYDDDGDINELCENLYKVSARCDKHFRSYTSKTKQAKYAEAMVQEDLSCDFIASIVMGNYDENGFVNVDNMQRYNPDAKSGFLADSMMWEQYGSKIQEVSPFQIFGLIVTIGACAILAVASMNLSKSIKGGRPWRPREFSSDAEMNRTNSGIVMGRSQSEMTPSELSDRNRSYYA